MISAHTKAARTQVHNHRTRDEVEALLEQKASHDSLTAALQQRIHDLETEAEALTQSRYAIHCFLVDEHPELCKEFVEVAYRECDTGLEHYAVASLHDQTIDLTTIKCTGSDFDPWEEP